MTPRSPHAPAPPAGAAEQARAGRSPWALVLALGLGVFVGGFDQTFVVPVLSRMLADLDIPINEFGKASWIINGYLLGYTVALPLMGRVADVFGHRRVFLLSLGVFMGGSALVAVAPDLWTLTAARAVTALGGGALVPVALAITADRLPPARRPLGLASISMLDDASSLLGPLWGTLIGVWLGWRGLFWMNIALGLPVLLAVLWLARDLPARGVGGRVDWPGGALLAVALTALTVALADTGSGRAALLTAALVALAGVAFIAFWRRERATAAPLIDLALFRSRRLVVANLLFFLEGAALITALVNVPLMTETLWGQSGAGPGLMLMRMVLFMIVGGLLGGLLAPRLGYRTTATAGFALTALGLLGMWWWPLEPSEGQRWLVLAVAGIGFTLPDAPLYATVVNGVAAARRASAAAVLQVMQTTGMIVAMALLASRGLGRFTERAADIFRQSGFEGSQEQYRIVMHRTFDETFAVAGALMLVATALALLLGGRAADEATLS